MSRLSAQLPHLAVRDTAKGQSLNHCQFYLLRVSSKRDIWASMQTKTKQAGESCLKSDCQSKQIRRRLSLSRLDVTDYPVPESSTKQY